MYKANERLDVWDWQEPVCYIFDDSKEYAMQCYSNLWEIKTHHPESKERIAGIAFGNDEYFAPLQAADFIAYATVLSHKQGAAVWEEGSIFRDLLLDIDPAWGKLYDGEHWSRDALEGQKEKIVEICNRQPIQTAHKKRPKN